MMIIRNLGPKGTRWTVRQTPLVPFGMTLARRREHERKMKRKRKRK